MSKGGGEPDAAGGSCGGHLFITHFITAAAGLKERRGTKGPRMGLLDAAYPASLS